LSRYGHASNEFRDPGSWDAASYWPDIASEIDGALDLATNAYREHNDFNDPGGWDKAWDSTHPIDSMEPLPDEPNPYRQVALRHLVLMYGVDQYLTEAKDARFAVIVVAIVLGWPSIRGMKCPRLPNSWV